VLLDVNRFYVFIKGGFKIYMAILLKRITNILTIAATILMVLGLIYVVVKDKPIGDFISEVALCYLAISAFNYLMFGAATLWHRDIKAVQSDGK